MHAALNRFVVFENETFSLLNTELGPQSHRPRGGSTFSLPRIPTPNVDDKSSNTSEMVTSEKRGREDGAVKQK